ncbi:hypothetical protein DFH07DRAFT_457522 [Mycena maculata]|uniref:Uncharacterized protein n=1 Tax=Mycena maculata TaxID=230809 RepID=A0AAD7J940_9AGAR|nr:hypothetical protein DFH07DRAFT_457522 [Mycena maculata]
MASLASSVPTAQLCDYCHQKPKHGTYAYCSKTCAAQTATLCNYCQKKPKYQNFDFCGKNCASLAAAVPTSGTRPAKNSASAQTPAGRPGANAAVSAPQAPVNPLLDPVHLAKLVVQHIPQVQSFLAAVAPVVAQPAAAAPVAPSASMPVPVAAPANPPKPRNNPFLNLSTPGPSNTAAASSGTAAPNSNAIQQPLNCLIPGCGQPVHVDSSGVMSDYCSRKHREEAVSSGLVSPCIMCMTLPQSDTDYFCGRDCREEAMNKGFLMNKGP